MKERILIVGKGYIGSRLHEEIGAEISEAKVFSLKDCQEQLDKYNPKVIINSVGFTGRNVDDCEANKDKTMTANTFVPIILAEYCFRHKIRLVHISTGCIYHYDYQKDSPIREDRVQDFYDLYYSRTKIYAEEALKFLSKKMPILIVRPRVPLDNRPGPKNLLSKLIASGKVIDLPNSVTYIPDFARALKHLIDAGAAGVFNLVNKGALYYPDLMQAYKEKIPDFNYQVINFKQLNIVRTNLILSTKKLEESGFKVRNTKDIIEECLSKYLKF